MKMFVMATFTFTVMAITVKAQSNQSFADHWEYVGLAVEEPGYTIRGTSPVIDDEGKVHLFVARWPGRTVEPGWRWASAISMYVDYRTEGPFTFSYVVIAGTALDSWGRYGTHKP